MVCGQIKIICIFLSGMQITEALKLQMEVQKRLQEQLEASEHIIVIIGLVFGVSVLILAMVELCATLALQEF